MHKWKLSAFDAAAQVIQLALEAAEVTVTPKIETEYDAVLLDPELSQHQLAPEQPLRPDPTVVQLSLTQSGGAKEFTKGALLKVDPTRVDVYEDADGNTKLDLATPIENAKLTGADPLKVYLFGTAAGAFKLTLEAEDPGDPDFKLEVAEHEMGVVALGLALHWHDQAALGNVEVDPNVAPIANYHTALKNEVLPAQKAMSDEEKVKQGRLLHVQDGDHFGRARLLLPKLTADQWPATCDDYEVVLSADNHSGAIELFDAEWEGHRLDLPLKLKVSDLQAADKELWVQGKTETDALGDVRLDVGLDRAAGGMAKQPKTKGNWGRFTVVKIEEVKIDYTAPANKPAALDTANKRFFVNFDPASGQDVTIGAKLSKPLQDVALHFCLSPHEDNRKLGNWGVGMPATWPWKDITWALKRTDKSDPKKLLHLSATTDANGYAKKELKLSRFGGDKFRPGAYLSEDPHLAKYVAAHADLKKKKPVQATDDVQVWRKFWYQMTRAHGFAVPLPATAVAAYDKVKAVMKHDQTREYTKATAPARTFYEKYIIAGGAATNDVAVVGSHNKNAIAALLVVKPEQPVKNHLIVCEYQYDEGGPTGLKQIEITAAAAGTEVELDMGDPIFDPPLQGGNMVVQLYWYRDSNPATTHNIPVGDASIPNPRQDAGGADSNSIIAVKVPAVAPPPAAGEKIYIVAQCENADGPYLGESFGEHSLIVYDASDVADYNDTVAHEIGHGFNQTPRPGKQPDPTHIPDHPNQADRGQGNHCQEDSGVDAGSGKTKYKCVMYDSGPMKWGQHEFCDVCHPYLLVEDMSSF